MVAYANEVRTSARGLQLSELVGWGAVERHALKQYKLSIEKSNKQVGSTRSYVLAPEDP